MGNRYMKGKGPTELLPLSSSTWSILHDRHYFSLECETLGSSSKNDEVQNHRSHQKIHNWPPRLPTRPTSSCMLLKGQRQLLEDSRKQAKLWWHNCQKLKAVSSNDIHHYGLV